MVENTIIGQQVQGYHIVQKLGSGGYGTVYLGEKEDLGKKYQTAIKHISMPDAEGYESVLQDYGYDKAATQAHFEKMVEGITAEINTLLELSKKDNRYIVAYYDHDIQKSTAPLRFDIFLRMEYLTPLNSHIRRKGFTLGEVIKLGLNMCDALSLCHNSGVMHRDIKEANIFVSENGNFKLGDFGVAKAIFETTQASSIKGTASYMAPEIYLREPYDNSVDIYSLGIVLYKLLNNLRLPFMPDAPAPFTVDDRNTAETRRLRGESPPLPSNAKNRLGEIAIKACSVKTERYARAEDLRSDLQAFLKSISKDEYNSVIIAPSNEKPEDYSENSMTSGTYSQTQGATVTMGAEFRNMAATASEQNPYFEEPSKKKKGKKKLILAAVITVLVVAAGVSAFIAYKRITDPVSNFQTAIKDQDYNEASQLFQGELKNGDAAKLEMVEEFVVSYADEIKAQYINGEIEYENALNQLREMEKFEADGGEQLREIIESVNALYLSRTSYDKAIESIEYGDYESAINDLRRVIQEDPNYAQAQIKISEAIRNYKDEVLDSLLELEADKQYDEAILRLKAGLLLVPDDADFLAQIEDYEKKIENDIVLEVEGVIREAKNMVSVSSDYAGALENLRAAARKYPNREELKESISEIEDAYLDVALAEAAQIASENGYASAVAALNGSLQVLPDNASIKAAISEYESKYPVLLQQLIYFTGRTLENGGQQMDNMQEMQTNIIDTDRGGLFDNTYKLDGKYVKITGVLYQPFDRRSDDSANTFEVFGDGRLLYSETMYGGKEPISFEVDLSGVNDFEIRLVSQYGKVDYHGGYSKLANVELHQ